MHKESPYNATSGALFKKKISNGRRVLWPKALLKNQKMWVANYFKYPQQVKLDVEKYVLNIYFCLWWNWKQMTPNNILCERVINQLQMEPNCWSFTFAVLITSIQLKQKVIRGVIWDGPSHQSLWTSPRAADSIQPRRYLSCKALERRSLPVQDLSPRLWWWKRSPGAPPALPPRGAAAPWFSSLSCLLLCKFYPCPVWFHVAMKGTEKTSKWPFLDSHQPLATLHWPSAVPRAFLHFSVSFTWDFHLPTAGSDGLGWEARAQDVLSSSSTRFAGLNTTSSCPPGPLGMPLRCRQRHFWSWCVVSTYLLKSLPSKAGTDLWGCSDIEGLQFMPRG